MTSTENIFLTQPTDTHKYFADPTLEAKTAGICDLFILLEKSNIQLALKERRSGNLLALEIIPSADQKQTEWKQLLEHTSANSKLLRNFEFLKVMVGVATQEFTLVPEALFKPGDESIYFKTNFIQSPGTILHSQHVPSFHLYTIFSIENELEKELNHLFQDPQLWHYSQALLTGISKQLKADAGKQVWLNIRKNKMDIVVSENKKLLLINSFSWQTNEDILYYTLFICEQLELNPEKFPMIVTGEIEEGSAIYSLLGKYIRYVEIPDSPASLSFAVATESLPFHHYAMLYNLALCE